MKKESKKNAKFNKPKEEMNKQRKNKEILVFRADRTVTIH